MWVYGKPVDSGYINDEMNTFELRIENISV